MKRDLLNETTIVGHVLLLLNCPVFDITAFYFYLLQVEYICRSQRLRGLRRRSVAALLLRLWVRISPEACLFFLLRVLCVVRYRSLQQTDHLSRGDLPTVVRRWVCSRNLVNEEALAHWGWGCVLLRQKKKKDFFYCEASEKRICKKADKRGESLRYKLDDGRTGHPFMTEERLAFYCCTEACSKTRSKRQCRMFVRT